VVKYIYRYYILSIQIVDVAYSYVNIMKLLNYICKPE